MMHGGGGGPGGGPGGGSLAGNLIGSLLAANSPGADGAALANLAGQLAMAQVENVISRTSTVQCMRSDHAVISRIPGPQQQAQHARRRTHGQLLERHEGES